MKHEAAAVALTWIPSEAIGGALPVTVAGNKAYGVKVNQGVKPTFTGR